MTKGNLPVYRFTFDYAETDQIGLWISGSTTPTYTNRPAFI